MRTAKPLLCLLLALLLTGCMAVDVLPPATQHTVALKPTAAPTATPVPTPTATPVPTPSPTPQITPVPTTMREVAPMPQVNPALLLQETGVFIDGAQVDGYRRATPLNFKAGEDYTQIDGVLTFRGNNYRSGGAFGVADWSTRSLQIAWTLPIGATLGTFSGDWTGVGWNGQPAIVRWPEKTKACMNLYEEKKAKADLTEVIYGTLDGNIYFLDLDDGTYTRDPICLGYPIKGSVSVDPRGLPLLFVGQGISDKDGVRASRSGWRIYSLLDQSELYFLNGHDELDFRSHRLFDSVCLVDAAADTLLECGENGLVYSLKLNSTFDADKGTLSIAPERVTYRYKADIAEYGIENSPTAYRNYLWFADNSGYLTCLDTTTMQPLWVRDCTDDTDASTCLEEDGDDLWLYTACEIDKQGQTGFSYMRKINALTGELVWEVSEPCKKSTSDSGVLATPTLGIAQAKELVYYSVCRSTERDSFLMALNKATGKEVWTLKLSRSSWSSPVMVQNEKGEAMLLHADGEGKLNMIDPLTGEILTSVALGSNVEGSPAVFGSTLVVGTRGQKIHAVKIA